MSKRSGGSPKFRSDINRRCKLMWHEFIQKKKSSGKVVSASLPSISDPMFFARILDKYFYYHKEIGEECKINCVSFNVEIIKKPGQSLGLFLRDGDGAERSSGVFVSRIAEGGELQKYDILRNGDEILSINKVEVNNVCLDDVVIMMSIPKRLLLHVVRKNCRDNLIEANFSEDNFDTKVECEQLSSEIANMGKDECEVEAGDLFNAPLSSKQTISDFYTSKMVKNVPTDLADSLLPFAGKKYMYTNLNNNLISTYGRFSAPVIVEQENFQVKKCESTLPFSTSSIQSDPCKRRISTTHSSLMRSKGPVNRSLSSNPNKYPPHSRPNSLLCSTTSVHERFSNLFITEYPKVYVGSIRRRTSTPVWSATIESYPYSYSDSDSRLNNLVSADIEPMPDVEGEKLNVSSPSLTGTLTVHIIEARDLRLDELRVNEPELMQCVIHVDNEARVISDTAAGISTFSWDQTFEIDIWECRHANFYLFQLQDSLKSMKHQGRLRLPEALLVGRRENEIHWFSLCLYPRGQLLITVTYQSLSGVYCRHIRDDFSERSMSQALAQLRNQMKILFVEVEKSAINEPSCYSMCASTENKLILRHQLAATRSVLHFEYATKNTTTITSLIKDLIKELPEPLVPNHIYQLFVEAWRVSLSQQFDAKASSLMDVIDGLPDANKDVFEMLVCHVKYATKKADVNGLTVMKASRIFGPLIFCSCNTHKLKSNTTPINFLDHQLASYVFQIILDIWPVASKKSSIETNFPMNSHSSINFYLENLRLQSTMQKPSLDDGFFGEEPETRC